MQHLFIALSFVYEREGGGREREGGGEGGRGKERDRERGVIEERRGKGGEERGDIKRVGGETDTGREGKTDRRR